MREEEAVVEEEEEYRTLRRGRGGEGKRGEGDTKRGAL